LREIRQADRYAISRKRRAYRKILRSALTGTLSLERDFPCALTASGEGATDEPPPLLKKFGKPTATLFFSRGVLNAKRRHTAIGGRLTPCARFACSSTAPRYVIFGKICKERTIILQTAYKIPAFFAQTLQIF